MSNSTQLKVFYFIINKLLFHRALPYAIGDMAFSHSASRSALYFAKKSFTIRPARMISGHDRIYKRHHSMDILPY
jgi:hypothetical protein